MNNRKGITPIAIVLLVVVAIAAVSLGVFYFSKSTNAPITSVDSSGSSPTSTVPTDAPASSSPTSTVSAPTSTATKITMTPSRGAVGTVIVISGSGFAATNTIEINGLTAAGLKGVTSADGKILKFKMPSTLGPNCNPNQPCAQFLIEVTSGDYTVTVISGTKTQNAGTFTVIGNSTQPTPAPTPAPSSGGIQGIY